MRKLVIAIMAVFALLYINPIDGYCAPNSVNGLSLIGGQSYSYNVTMNNKNYTIDVFITYYNGVNEDGIISNVADSVYMFNVDNSAYDYNTYLGNPQPVSFITFSSSQNVLLSFEMKSVRKLDGVVDNESISHGTLQLQTTFTGVASQIIEKYENNTALQEYAAQFLYDDATMSDFIEYFKTGGGSKNYIYAFTSDADKKATYPDAEYNYSCPSLDLTAGLIPEGEHTGIYSNEDKFSIGTEVEALPYLFVSPNDDDGKPNAPNYGEIGNEDDSNYFIAYYDSGYKLTLTGTKNVYRFYWDSSKYSDYDFIEVRATPYDLETTHNYESCLISSYNTTRIITGETCVRFNSNEIKFDESNLSAHYGFKNFFGMTIDHDNYYFELRGISSDGSKFSNWCGFKISSGNTSINKYIMDDEGNILCDDVNSLPNYDPNFALEGNPNGDLDNGDYGDGSTPLPGNSVGDATAREKLYENYNPEEVFDIIAGMIDSIKTLPSMLTTLFAFFPSSLITLIGLSLSLLFIVLIIKLFR